MVVVVQQTVPRTQRWVGKGTRSQGKKRVGAVVRAQGSNKGKVCHARHGGCGNWDTMGQRPSSGNVVKYRQMGREGKACIMVIMSMGR